MTRFGYREPYERRLERATKGVSRTAYSNFEMLTALRACAREIGRTPGVQVFDRWSKTCCAGAIVARLGSWRAACLAAGLEPPPVLDPRMGARRFTDGEIQASYARIRELAGRPPSLAEWQKYRLPSEIAVHGLRKRYGGWTGFLRVMES